MYRLNCNIQKYGWGKRGHQSKVALYKSAQDTTFALNEAETYAELWMGTHPNCPSTIELNQNDKKLLSDYLRENMTQAFGEAIIKHFYETTNEHDRLNPGDLPFLFKILSINQALSIQAHPNKQLARQLHANDPKNYPDDNHKPEMIIAISDEFEAMCGFRPVQEISRHLQSYQELTDLCGAENAQEFIRLSSTDNQKDLESVLRLCFTSLMNKDEKFIIEKLESLKQRLTSQTELSYLDNLFLKLDQQYKNDVGCFSIFLLNCIILKRGEAICLSANIPHAYLFGDGVECMACSDNVVRAGLTPKFKDVKVLCDMLDYTMRSAEENKLKSTRTDVSAGKDYLCEFRPPGIDEFSVQEVKVKLENFADSNRVLIPQLKTGSILIINETSTDNSWFELGDGSRQSIKPGLIYFINSQTDVYFCADKNGLSSDRELLLGYRAYCDPK